MVADSGNRIMFVNEAVASLLGWDLTRSSEGGSPPSSLRLPRGGPRGSTRYPGQGETRVVGRPVDVRAMGRDGSELPSSWIDVVQSPPLSAIAVPNPLRARPVSGVARISEPGTSIPTSSLLGTRLRRSRVVPRSAGRRHRTLSAPSHSPSGASALSHSRRYGTVGRRRGTIVA